MRYSKEFDDADAEITYISSDNIRFRVHAVNLKARTEGLAPPEGMSYREAVHLSEPAPILRLLFKFLYPNPNGAHQPSTVFSLDSDMEFDLLKGLAEAAEKYQVFPAMYFCLLRMHATLPDHAVPILGYAFKHDYPDLADSAAPRAVGTPLTTIVDTIPFDSLKRWCLYCGRWEIVQKCALTIHLPRKPCFSALSNFSGNLSVFTDPGRLSSACSCGKHKGWIRRIKGDVRDVPKLSQMKEETEENHKRVMNRIADDYADDSMDDDGWDEDDDDEDESDDDDDSDRYSFHFHADLSFDRGSLDGNPRSPTPASNNDFMEGDSIIESSDGIRYYMYANMLAPTGFNLSLKSSNYAKIEEKSSVIGLLLKFTKAVRLPDLRSLPFTTLNELAYAAEKYSVWEAIWICRIFMKKSLQKHPRDVFKYAADHRCLDILDAAAPLVVGQVSEFSDTLSCLQPAFMRAWTDYYQQWQDVTKEVLAAIMNQRSSPQSTAVIASGGQPMPIDPAYVAHFTHQPAPMSFESLFMPPTSNDNHSPSPLPIQGYTQPSCNEVQYIPGLAPIQAWFTHHPAYSPGPSQQVNITRASNAQASTSTRTTTTNNNQNQNQNQQPIACSCGNMQSHLVPVMKKLMNGPAVLRDLKKLFPAKTQCPQAKMAFEGCKELIEEMVGRIPPFSSFLYTD